MAKIVPPDWRILVWDETDYWLDKTLIKRCGGKIKGVYFFDACRHVHCCDTSPSYELHFIESIPEKWPEDETKRDRLQADLQEGDAHSEPVTYSYCRNIDLNGKNVLSCWEMNPDEWQALLDDADGDDEQAHLEAEDACREFVSQNGLY